MIAGSGGLYDSACRPISPAAPFPGPTDTPLIGAVLCLVDEPSCPGVARLWVMPTANATRAVPRRIAAELVAALHHDMQVAILGHDVARVRAAAAAVLELAEAA